MGLSLPEIYNIQYIIIYYLLNLLLDHSEFVYII